MGLTAEKRADRDELVARLLAQAPGGITEYELARVIRAATGQHANTSEHGSGAGRDSLRRLQRAGRARCVTEPHSCRYGFRRVWFPAGEGS